MDRQMLIYDTPEQVSSEIHGALSLRTDMGFGFAAGLNSLPIVAAEFERISESFAIVFAGEGAGLMPVAILGLSDGENSYVGDDGSWHAPYVPAFLRRYPFVFADGEAEGSYVLCIDRAHAGLNEDGEGERLFDSAGRQTKFLESMVQFTSDYQGQFNATRAFCDRIEALGLLEPSEATVQRPDGSTASLTGFRSVNAQKLRALDDADALALLRDGGLELCYRQIASLGNLTGLGQRSTG